MSFIHTVETVYNFDSTVHLDALVDKCIQLEMDKVLVADRHTIHHAVDTERLKRSSGVAILQGIRFDVKIQNHFYSILLIASNNVGLENLYTLSTLAHNKEGIRTYIDSDDLQQHHQHLRAVIEFDGRNKDDLVRFGFIINGMRKLFKSNVWLEMLITDEKSKEHAKIVKWLSAKTNIPLFASNRVCFLEKDEALLREVRRAAHEEESVIKDSYESERYFKSTQEMAELFCDYPEALRGNTDALNGCSTDITLRGDDSFVRRIFEFPTPSNVVIPQDMYNEFVPVKEYRLPEDPKKLRSIAYLIQLAKEGMALQFGSNPNASNRLKYELGIIISKGFVDYFLGVWDLLNFCRETGIETGPGRGSSGGSLLAKCLNITEVDPLEYGLLFERFLNPERNDDPDIDIDISSEKRHLVIKYALDRYGFNRVARIVTFGRFGVNDGVRKITSLLGYDKKVGESIISVLPEKLKSLKEFVKTNEASTLKEMARKDEEIRQVVHLAMDFADLIQNTAINSGIIITNEDLVGRIPLMSDYDPKIGRIYTSQIPSKHAQLEALGYTKIDLLGLVNIDVASHVKKWIKQLRGVDIQSIPMNDAKTLKLFQDGEVFGVFQMDSPGMRETCRKVKPRSIREIIDIIALYRPGPMKKIPTYIENRGISVKGIPLENGEILVGTEELAPIIEETNGILIYQEQVMRIANIWAGYSLGQAETLRQVISKKKEELLEGETARFMETSKKNGRNAEVTQKLFELIKNFIHYGFNKNHAAVYAHLVYTGAYFKANYPIEYMAVRIGASVKSKPKCIQYAKEAMRMGIQLFPPNVMESTAKFAPTNNGIQFGLTLIKDVGVNTANLIEKERGNGPFLGYQDFVQRVGGTDCNKTALEALAKAGALDVFGSRKEIIEDGNSLGHPYGVFSFSDIPDLGLSNEKEDYSLEEKRDMEIAQYGFSCSPHPLSHCVEAIEGLIQSKQGGEWVYGNITHIKVKKDRYKREMADIVIDGPEETVTLVVFNSKWKLISSNVQKNQIVLCSIEKKEGNRAILKTVEELNV